MGQHKHNPNCQLAREGKLPPRPAKMGKREKERLLYAKCLQIIFGSSGADLHKMLPRKTKEMRKEVNPNEPMGSG